jgi:hypothetical protein
MQVVVGAVVAVVVVTGVSRVEMGSLVAWEFVYGYRLIELRLKTHVAHRQQELARSASPRRQSQAPPRFRAHTFDAKARDEGRVLNFDVTQYPFT